MARDSKTEAAVETAAAAPEAVATEAAATAAAPATPAEAKGDERFIILDVKLADGSVVPVKRKDYIKAMWTGEVTSYNPEGVKHSRGDIARKLTELQGKTVPYQIVFGATRGVAGGPEKEVVPPATGAATTEETSTTAETASA